MWNRLSKSNVFRRARDHDVQWLQKDHVPPSQACKIPTDSPLVCCTGLSLPNKRAKFNGEHANKFGREKSVARDGLLRGTLQRDTKSETGNESQSFCGDERRGVRLRIPGYARDNVARAWIVRTRSAGQAIHETSAACILCDGRGARDRCEFCCLEVGTLAKMAQAVVAPASCHRICKSLRLRDHEGARIRISMPSPGRDIVAGRWRSQGIRS